jgi:LuxR family maltose regulon positive regulatory protein
LRKAGSPGGEALDAARRLLDRLLAAAEAGGRLGGAIEIRVLRALAHQARGDRRAALADLGRALAAAAPEGYARVFVDEGRPLARLLRPGSRTRSAATDPARIRRAACWPRAPRDRRAGPAAPGRSPRGARRLPEPSPRGASRCWG